MLGSGEDGRALLGWVALADHGTGLHVEGDDGGLIAAHRRGTQLHPLEHLVAEDRSQDRSGGLTIHVLSVLPQSPHRQTGLMAVSVLRFQAHDRPISLVGGNGVQSAFDRYGCEVLVRGVSDEAVRPPNQNALLDLE